MNTNLLWKRVAYCARQHPALATAAHSAAVLVLAGGVQIHGDIAHVKTLCGSEPAHTVNLIELTCDCADYPTAPTVNGTPQCVHLLAALLVSRPAPAISREQWEAFYHERDRHEARLKAIRAGVKALV